MKISEYIQNLEKKGQQYFTLEDALANSEKSRVLTLESIRRLRIKGLVAKPFKDFYVIIPPQYQIYGCLPAEQFIPDLMAYLKLPYYVGLLSAAHYYGAAHQKPQQFQVVTRNYIPPLVCGRVYVVFIMNKVVSYVPTQQVNTATGYLTLSSPEATAIDLVQYSRRSGGLNNIVTVLIELIESMDPKSLSECLKSMKTDIVTLQRLGYCLDLVEQRNFSDVIHKHLRLTKLRTRPLVSGISTCNTKRDKKWELYINFNVEPDL